MPFESKNLRESLDFLNILTENLDSAIFIVDKDFRVQALNSLCEKWFHKRSDELFGELCGNSMGCEFTILSGKVCGTSANCSSCNLRNSVKIAFEDKIASDNMPLCRRFQGAEGMEERYYLYSTHYLTYQQDDMVLVILNDVTEREKQSRQIEKTRLELEQKNKIVLGDLEMARKVQQELFPSEYPESPYYEVYGLNVPVEQLGGDFFDIRGVSEQELLFFISDVSGHGAPSALISAMQKPVITRYFTRSMTSGEILTRLNISFSNLMGKEGFFLTALTGRLDLKNGIVEYATASHPDLIVLRKDGTAITLPRGKKDLLIGPFAGIDYTTFSEPIYPGDFLAVYTDGVVEALNPENEQFGMERFLEILENNRHKPLPEITDEVINQIRLHSLEGQLDDITLLLIRIKDTVF